MAVLHSAPKYAPNHGVRETLAAALGSMVLDAKEECDEVVLTVQRERIEDALRLLRDEHDYQMLMEIAGVDYPSRVERFEIVYMLLSITKNHRVMVKVSAAEDIPVPTVTTLWPVAGWLEREIFDLFGVIFAGNPDLRRILTDYGFEGHPFRKDFPLTGYVEIRYSEEDKRVVYEPVRLDQDLRSFDFLSPWEGADYQLPGDEKATPSPSPVVEVKVTGSPKETGAGEKTDAKAAERVAPSVAAMGTIAGQGQSEPTPIKSDIPAPGAPDPTADRPSRPPSGGASADEGDGPAPEGS